jgi:hypothetical protein
MAAVPVTLRYVAAARNDRPDTPARAPIVSETDASIGLQACDSDSEWNAALRSVYRESSFVLRPVFAVETWRR